MSPAPTPRPGRCGPARAPSRGQAKAGPGPQPPPLICSAARAPAAEPAALRCFASTGGGGGAGAAPLRASSAPCGQRCGRCGQRPPLPGRRDVFIRPQASPGSRELGRKPAEPTDRAVRLRKPTSLLPRSSASSSPAPGPPPLPPVEVEVAAAPAEPCSWARAPPPAGTRHRGRGIHRRGAGETGHSGPAWP